VPKKKFSLEPAYLRVERALGHLEALEEAAESVSDEWGQIFIERLGRRVPAEELLQQMRAKVPIPKIPPKIPILAGETAYNLRAALDYSIGQLSRYRTPPRKGERPRRTQFPIESSPDGFAKRRKTFLYGLSDDDVLGLERYQPYKRCRWTADLQRLSNVDKHNDLIEVRQGFALRAFPDGSAGFELDPYLAFKYRHRKPLVRVLKKIIVAVCAFLDELGAEFPDQSDSRNTGA
jgi:hypothetical protein